MGTQMAANVEATAGVSGPLHPESRRFDSVDLLRGLIIALMLLDHVRDFAHAAAFAGDPTDLSKTTFVIFMTRWVTHLCAPGFVFLAGLGAFLYLQRKQSRRQASVFLVTRGLWLVLLEFTVVHLLLSFRLDPNFIGIASVFWMIGISMVVLGGLIWLPTWAVGAFGVAMIATHNLFDSLKVAAWGGPGSPAPTVFEWLWTVLHRPGLLPLSADGTPMVFIAYPLIPWIGVMAAGFAFGTIYTLPKGLRARRIAFVGAGLLAVFLILRAFNVYGDPGPWTQQRNAVFSVLSFIRVNKYPPSLLFLCVTLGIDLLLLAWFEHRQNAQQSSSLEKALIVFGRVPLFFFVIQWIVAHGGPLVAMMVAGQDYSRLLYNPVMAPPAPPGTGFSLGVVYAIWLAGLVVLYFPCRWFAGLKARRRDWWLSYL